MSNVGLELQLLLQVLPNVGVLNHQIEWYNE